MSESYLWHLLPGRHWPASTREEETFVAELAAVVGDAARTDPRDTLGFERGHITAVANALRCGLTLTELRTVAPGIEPRRLLWAYDYLNGLLQNAIDSFNQILADPTEEMFRTHGIPAADIAPVPTHALWVAFAGPRSDRCSDEHRDEIRSGIDMLLDEARQQSDTLETELESWCGATDGNDPTPVRLGRTLYNPHGPSLWGHPCFVPARVGQLVPDRIRDLLGEQT